MVIAMVMVMTMPAHLQRSPLRHDHGHGHDYDHKHASAHEHLSHLISQSAGGAQTANTLPHATYAHNWPKAARCQNGGDDRPATLNGCNALELQ